MSMSAASMDCRNVRLQDELREDSIAIIDISTAGTWQRRGHASLNGLVIIAMDTNECVDWKRYQKHVETVKQMKEKNTVQWDI